MSAPTDFTLSLAPYQQNAVSAIQDTLQYVAELHGREPEKRTQIARQLGVILLQSPTGSGKTLILGRALEAARGKLHEKTVWFWFAPFTGLVAQTRSALAAQCGSLRMRDIYTDREPTGARDGDIFVQTWASVAANRKDSRRIRRDKEDSVSIDTMLDELRNKGFRIGVVIDEAHLNFGAGASATASFYLDVLAPDYTILATATPNDTKLQKFERDVGLKVESRIVIGREDVVSAGLNKVGLMVGVLSFKEEDRDLIDTEVATLTAGWSQHQFIKNRLAEKNISVTPLMLVQVEDQGKGKEDPVGRVRERLIEIGVPDDCIAVHTSGEPDPEFHTLAYDPQIQVLIFKVAVATGFDAPRAWTLVSVRPSRGKDFGLQIVGRIMRVHPLVRPCHGSDPLLDRGYVFLSDPALQIGLEDAAADMKAVREGIEVLTDRMDVNVIGGGERAANIYQATPQPNATPLPSVVAESEQQRIEYQLSIGMLNPNADDASLVRRTSALSAVEGLVRATAPPLFPNLPEVSPASAREPSPKMGHQKRYPLRTDLGIPPSLIREELPNLYDIEADLCPEIARIFCQSVPMAAMLNRVFSGAELSMRDLFNAGETDSRKLNVRMSSARIAEQAQAQLTFNDGIDPRRIRESVESELSKICEREGIEADRKSIRRTLNLAILKHPQSLKEAVRKAQGQHIRLESNEPIPTEQFGPQDAPITNLGAYGAFLGMYNRPERAFAEMLDHDETGTIKWWLRNAESTKWATRLILPTGKRFFPDFVVGITGRRTPDSIALVEIKDDGETGRLQSDSNALKIRSEHQDYKKVFWSFRENDGIFVKAVWNETHNRIFGNGPYEIADMVIVN